MEKIDQLISEIDGQGEKRKEEVALHRRKYRWALILGIFVFLCSILPFIILAAMPYSSPELGQLSTDISILFGFFWMILMGIYLFYIPRRK